MIQAGNFVRAYTSKNRRSYWDGFVIHPDGRDDNGRLGYRVRHMARVVNGRAVVFVEEKGWYPEGELDDLGPGVSLQ